MNKEESQSTWTVYNGKLGSVTCDGEKFYAHCPDGYLGEFYEVGPALLALIEHPAKEKSATEKRSFI